MKRYLVAYAVVYCVASGCGKDSGGSPPLQIQNRQDETEKHGLRWQFNYDGHGLVSEIINPAGELTEIAYQRGTDGVIHGIERRFVDGSKVVVALDSFGRRTIMQDDLGNVRYEYADGHLAGVYRHNMPAIAFAHDRSGRRLSAQVGGRPVMSLAYDRLTGRVRSIQTAVGTIKYEPRHAENSLVRTLPNGVCTTWQFQPDGKLAHLRHAAPGGKESLLECRYRYRSDGKVSEIHESHTRSNRVVKYEYDVAGRLVLCDDSAVGVTQYSYDPSGNRILLRLPNGTHKETSHDWAGRIAIDNDQPCSYDAAGSLIRFSRDGQPVNLNYSPEGQLSRATTSDGEVAYRRDGDGKLVSRTIGQQMTTFLHDPTSDVWKPLAVVSKGATETIYVWEDEVPIAAIRGDNVHYYLGDHLGSVRCVTDGQGDVTERRDYCPFGTPQEALPSRELEPGFCGLFYDPLARVYLARDRSYDPQFGRFTTPDPVQRVPSGAPHDLPPGFVYCGNDPVNFVDLDGAEPDPFNTHRLGHQPINLQQTAAQLAQAAPPHFDWALGLGWGSGNLNIDDILRQGQGRFQVIYVTGSPARMVGTGWHPGPIADFVTLPTPQAIRGPEMWAPFTATNVVAHSGANSHDIPASHVFRIGASRQGGLPFNEVIAAKGDPVPRLSGLHPVVRSEPGGGRFFGVNVRVPFDMGANPVRVAQTAVQDMVLGVQGVAQAIPELSKAASNAVLGTSFPVFREHSVAGYFTQLGTQLPAPATYSQVQVVYPDGRKFQGTYQEGRWQTQAINALVSPQQDSSRISYTQTQNAQTSSTANGPGLSIGGSPPATRKKDIDLRVWHSIRQSESAPLEIEQSTGSVKANNDSGAAGAKTTSVNGSQGPSGPSQPHNRSSGDGQTVPNPALPSPEATPNSNSMVPSNIGGVYLGQTAAALDKFGTFSGIAVVDSRLVLLSEETERVQLPPLRLQDVAQIFRAVFQHGEAMWLSIDPDPQDASGSSDMLVRFGPGEPGYVTWVLFMCDRIMKDFSISTDHRTGRPIETTVRDYRSVLDLNADSSRTPGGWVRYWIVPSGVSRRVSADRGITLLDVPLEVRTQAMLLRDGKLVPAQNDRAPGASVAFARWFTKHYDELEREVCIVPPKSSGIDEPVPVFAELRRIASVVAAAEALRAQGVAMPAWMADFPNSQCSVPTRTPAINSQRTTERGNRRSTHSIYGGVTLSVDDDRLHITPASPEANDLQPALQAAVVNQPALTPASFTHHGRRYRAVALPTPDAQALGACRLSEVDLSVSVRGGARLQMTRHFHSFFRGGGELGPAWTLDLPFLEQELHPLDRAGGRTRFHVVHRLITPLHSYVASFRKEQFVPELNSRLPVPAEKSACLALASQHVDLLGQETTCVFLRDGRRWHFDKAGRLVCEHGPTHTTLYQRDGSGRLSAIEAYEGRRIVGSIRLHYDQQHGERLRAAVGSNGNRVVYEYDADGCLRRADRPHGVTMGYEYQGGRVSGYLHGGKLVRRFQYTPAGHLVAENNPDGSRLLYQLKAGGEGAAIVAQHKKGDTVLNQEAAAYDAKMRLVSRRLPSGAQANWKHLDSGDAQVTLRLPTGDQYRIEQRGDGRKELWYASDGRVYQVEFDNARRLTALFAGDRLIVRQAWRPDGLLGLMADELITATITYGDDGLFRALDLAPNQRADALDGWLKIETDGSEKTTRLRDAGGLDLWVRRDAAGTRLSVEGKQGRVGFIQASDARVQRISTSWGDEQELVSDSENRLSRVVQAKDGNKASVDYAEGRPTRVQCLGGGAFEIDYFATGRAGGRVREVKCPDGTVLAYVYDDRGRLASVTCGAAYRIEYTFDDEDRLIELKHLPN